MASSCTLRLGALALLLLLLAPGGQACSYGCFFWQTNCKRTKQLYAQLVNLSASQGRTKIHNLAVAQALSVLQNDPSGLTAHYLQKALNNLATANSARYICIKNAVLKVMCDSQFNDEGYTIIIYLLKVPKISAPSRVFSLLAQAPCRWALKGYISYMNRSGKMNGIYAAAAC